MFSVRDEPWNPTDATYAIREIGCHPALSLAYKVHATQRIVERGIIVSDLLSLIRNGFVFEEPVAATQQNYFRYVIQGVTPNSGGRQIAAVLIPNAATMTIKIVTVYWVDEQSAKSGSIMENIE